MKLFLLKIAKWMILKKNTLIILSIIYTIIMIIMQIFKNIPFSQIWVLVIFYVISIILGYFFRFQIIAIDFFRSLNNSLNISEYEINWLTGAYLGSINFFSSIIIVSINIITMLNNIEYVILSIIIPVMTIFSLPHKALEPISFEIERKVQNK